MGWSSRAAALRLGVTQRTVFRWLNEGIGDHVADRIAVQLNTHPALLWPGWRWSDMALASGAEGEEMTG